MADDAVSPEDQAAYERLEQKAIAYAKTALDELELTKLQTLSVGELMFWQLSRPLMELAMKDAYCGGYIKAMEDLSKGK